MDPLKTLITLGADMSLQEAISGNTALHIAINNGNNSAFGTLLRAGAPPTISNRSVRAQCHLP